MTEQLAQIYATHFTAGIVLDDDVVIEAAPIVRYMKGWKRATVADYCRVKRWGFLVIE
jgi:hypothetical protein